ncbi:MAG: TetR family transcriptional regulator [Candidatus Dormibacteraeota bacterium]|uniref:TetR family transcriptional regulator n=1 Tax=Candidatus Amunia macphersoniae TaxID=3127014 RepID=A0A934NF36_9BACT|nr:TetR family transcriptional regulator [Candidatus Dormibacteraeota bacterium]
MGGAAARVKPRRRYDASRRREAANRRRAAVIAAAQQRFLSDGYVNTTVAAIAADAAVSVDAVYKAFGGKPGLVRAIWNRALEGAGPVAAERRSDALHAPGADPREIVQGWGRLAAEVAPLATPLMGLIDTAAASDPELRSLRDELDDNRLRRMTANARRLRDGGHLRPGVSLSAAAAVLWTYSSPELCDLLVFRRGWSPARYGRFIADAMVAALL